MSQITTGFVVNFIHSRVILTFTILTLLLLSSTGFSSSSSNFISDINSRNKFNNYQIQINNELNENNLQTSQITNLSTNDLENFVDSFFTTEKLQQYSIPGMTISFTNSTSQMLARGFGYANLFNFEQVEANNTIFRAASVSKNIITIAVLQQVEEGNLALDEDINNYLDGFEIGRGEYTEPITLHHLLTHTAGFDEIIGLGYAPGDFIDFLEDSLKEVEPLRYYPVGEIINYSNYGYGLAAFIVEEIAGKSFRQYVKTSIFNPLNMSSSGFEQPFPFEIKQRLATEYIIDNNGAHQPIDDYYFNPYPAGALFTTSTDMSKIGQLWLNNGTVNGVEILSPSTVTNAMSRQFATHPQLDSWSYGFYEELDYGARLIHHAGDIRGFASDFVVVPELDIAYFFSQNTAGTGIRENFMNEFMQIFSPVSIDTPTPTDDFVSRLPYYQGEYWYVRYPHEKLNQINNFQPLAFELSADIDQEFLILTFNPENPTSQRMYKEISPFLFVIPETKDHLFIELTSDQQLIKYVHIEQFSFEAISGQTPVLPSTSATDQINYQIYPMTILPLLITRFFTRKYSTNKDKQASVELM